MNKAINLGHLNRRILIQEETASRGDSGQEILNWTTLHDCWAKVDYPNIGSGEEVQNDQVIVTTRTDFTIRYRAGLDEKMRVVYQGVNYSIANISEIERRHFLLLQCFKIV